MPRLKNNHLPHHGGTNYEEAEMNFIKKSLMKVMAKGSKPMMEHMFVMTGDLCRAFYEKDGKEALPIITKIATEGGVERAKIMQQMMPTKDMKGIAELFKLMDSMMEMGMEITEQSDDAIHFKVPKCIMGIEGTSKELCEAMMSSDTGMVSALLGKEVETKIPKSIAAGDKECEVIFSIKK
jgi:predicted hydrocarbon binding protein